MNNKRTLAFIWYLMVTILGMFVLGIEIIDYRINGITFENAFFTIVSLYIMATHINKIEKLFE
jgi:hypothetical protein